MTLGKPRCLHTFLAICFTFFLTLPLFADEAPRLAVHLLDYLAKDYAGAVGDNGQVLSESEYAEQREFAGIIVKTIEETPALASHESLKTHAHELETSIGNKTAPAVVTQMARSLQQEVVQVSGLVLSPTKWPDLKVGADLYAQNCVTCHGATGAGDGPGGVALDPPPANFRDTKLMSEVAPSGAFNTIRLGVPGTGMPPFQAFSDDQIWALAFYVVSLHHTAPATPGEIDLKLLNQVATLPDSQLQEQLGGNADLLSQLRTYTPDHKNSLELAKTLLNDAGEAGHKGEWAQAKQLALKAYLEGIEPVEPRLRGLSSELLARIETVYANVRATVERQDKDTLDDAIAKAQDTTNEAELLIQGKKLDNRLAFLASSGILLREGFEAALVVISLLGVIRATGFRRAAYWVHGGWILAILLGFISWFLLGVVFDISGAQRELLEGGTSLIAVVILLTVGFWLHKHSEIERWTRFIKEKVKDALDNKNLMALGSISFLAVFREAMETVLFLRVLWLDADAAARTSLLSGIVATGILILVLAWIVVRTSTRLPVTQIFRISSFIMALLAVILTGKGIHSLQESGLISEHVLIPALKFDFFGIYPSTAVVVSQLLVLGIIFFFWRRNTQPAKA